ncbi:FAD-dependent monooxygenase [Streptomyces sp. OR43]|uniref:FAD-dependent monooxygenase n=1 Tax=Streptomyces sp. or43 TaxID=2478957 RepID=UPI0011CE3E2C|nr:FAD-dependent monooxygenase [Streptomyces sp. or43]TXS38844.1 2-polyprenyl-6-methoxyphenol hydroxylase [Streptomyces sp. or43]
MPAVSNVLVVGGGTAGTAAAILLAEVGVAVDLVELKPDITALGSGITLQGNALRVLRRLGVWDDVQREGHSHNRLALRAPDAEATVLVELDVERTGGPDLPATVGMYRPALARILMDRAVATGVKVRTSTTFAELEQDGTGVTARFTDGSTGRYDLVIGADGIRSATRQALGIDADIQGAGLGAWRAIVPRPASVTHTELYYGGPSYISGYCPINDRAMYAYFTEIAQDRMRTAPEEKLAVMRTFAEHYHGPWDEIRESLTDPSAIHYTWFESHLLDDPWHRGRVLLIGDAAHSCPPTLAQGAAMALEDAQVLAEMLATADRVDDELLESFARRRLPRARAVVEASRQIVQWTLARDVGDVPALQARIAALVTDPA